MHYIFVAGASLIMMGISFIIMSFGCITNKYVVYFGLLLAIISIVFFLVGNNDLIFVNNNTMFD